MSRPKYIYLYIFFLFFNVQLNLFGCHYFVSYLIHGKKGHVLSFILLSPFLSKIPQYFLFFSQVDKNIFGVWRKIVRKSTSWRQPRGNTRNIISTRIFDYISIGIRGKRNELPIWKCSLKPQGPSRDLQL